MGPFRPLFVELPQPVMDRLRNVKQDDTKAAKPMTASLGYLIKQFYRA